LKVVVNVLAFYGELAFVQIDAVLGEAGSEAFGLPPEIFSSDSVARHRLPGALPQVVGNGRADARIGNNPARNSFDKLFTMLTVQEKLGLALGPFRFSSFTEHLKVVLPASTIVNG